MAALFLLLSAVVLLWQALRRKGVAVLAILLVVVNLLYYGMPFIVTAPLSQTYAVPEFVAFLQQQPGIWRVYDADNALHDNYQAVWRLQAVQGYNPLRLSAYVALTQDINVSTDVPPELNLLNAQFIVATTPLHNPDLTLVHQSTAYVYENPDALPRAFVVKELTDAIPAKSAVTEQNISAYTADSVTIETDSTGGVLVLGDINYPGWVARVDGELTPVLTAYGGVRAIAISPGKHTVVFSFEPLSAKIGLVITYVSVLVAVALVLFLRPARARGRRSSS
jgi:hypothetical protein